MAKICKNTYYLNCFYLFAAFGSKQIKMNIFCTFLTKNALFVQKWQKMTFKGTFSTKNTQKGPIFFFVAAKGGKFFFLDLTSTPFRFDESAFLVLL